MAVEPLRILCLIRKVEDLLQTCSRGGSIDRVMTFLPSVSQPDVDMLIKACHSRKKSQCLLLVAVRYDCLEHLANLELDARNLQGPLLKHLFYLLVSKKRWSCLGKFLLLKSPECLSTSLLLELALRRPEDEAASLLLQAMLDRCTKADVRLLRAVVGRVARAGKTARLRFFIYSANPHVQRAVYAGSGEVHWLADLVERSCETNAAIAYKECLRMTCDAGLFVVPAPCKINGLTPFSVAVEHKQPDIVRLLYEAGAVTNHKLFQLCSQLELEAVREGSRRGRPAPSSTQDQEAAAREVREFVRGKASQPRSLQDLCLLQLSTCLGWGHIRMVNIAQLPIPPIFKEDLPLRGNMDISG